jgi:cell division protease FtsH
MIFLGREISEQRNYSDDTARIIDLEVKRLVDCAHERARTILKQNLDVLDALATKLLEVETIGGEEMRQILSMVRRFEPRGNGHVTTLPTPQTTVVVAPGMSPTDL